MARLETIVPVLELCKQIPAGKFWNTALVWIHSTMRFVDGERDGVPFGNLEPCDRWFVRTRCLMKSNEIYPAPTLAEILNEIENVPHAPRDGEDFVTCRADWHKTWRVHNGKIGMYAETSATNAALRLWLKLEGVNKND